MQFFVGTEILQNRIIRLACYQIKSYNLLCLESIGWWDWGLEVSDEGGRAESQNGNNLTDTEVLPNYANKRVGNLVAWNAGGIPRGLIAPIRYRVWHFETCVDCQVLPFLHQLECRPINTWPCMASAIITRSIMWSAISVHPQSHYFQAEVDSITSRSPP